ncbi:MAG: phosphate uptake regulator PhoU [Candidatus Thermoplasmatota archaeon]
MELRKLQVTGGSTHVVSLPKKWIDRNKLGRSDTVAIHEEPDGSLLLIPHSEARAETRTLTVELPDNPPTEEVVRRLVGAYLAGADEIQVRSPGKMDPKVRETIRTVSRSLVGVEIQDEGAQSLTLMDLVGVADMDLRKTLTRMQRIARLMFDDALKALEARDVGAAKDVARRDDELDRLLWMVSKQMHALLEQPRLAAKLNVRPAEALNLFLAARSLERMGDHAAKMCLNVIALDGHKLPKDVSESMTSQAHTVRTLWDDAFSSLKRPDFVQASRAADAGEAAAAWRANFPTLVRGMAPETVGPLTLIADSIDRTRGYAIDLAETAMNQTYQSQV